MFLLSADEYREISTVTRSQAQSSGFLHWSRGPCSFAAGGSLRTGAILKRSTGGVSGSLADRWSNPSSSMQGCPSSLSSPALLHKLQVITKIPQKTQNTTVSNRFPPKLQKPSIKHPLVQWKVSELDGSHTGEVVLY